VGWRTRPDPHGVPMAELFESMSVLSYRDTPSDPEGHFVCELSACGRPFVQYDLDARTFSAPARRRDYGRTISATRYGPLTLRGHAGRGFWLELPDSAAVSLLPGQFDELYRTTLGYMKPVGIVTTVLGTLSGYSIGFRAGAWGSSPCNHNVQERLLETPHIARLVQREAWRRVLLEPMLTGEESEARAFAATWNTQRIYSNFFKLALSDSDGFIPREAERLDSLGRTREARAMRAFARAVRRAASDTCDLVSADFAAIEDWASLLDRKGHWARGAIPAAGEERIRYLGTLAWYGLAPAVPDERRIWVGPRALVREGDTDGFVADDIPATGVGCPIGWRDFVRGNPRDGVEEWTAEWIGGRKEFAPIVSLGRRLAARLGALK